MRIIIFIIGGVVGAVLVFFLMRNKVGNNTFEEYNQAVEKRKEEAKSKILDYLRENKTITNDNVEDLLNVSDATSTRYLQELEDDSRIMQEGEGRGVFYRLK